MRSDEYRRIRAVFLDMAEQSSVPDVKARWLAMATDCLKLVESAERDQQRIVRRRVGQSRVVR
jgi:hypothetical protein